MIPKNVDTTGIDVSYHWSNENPGCAGREEAAMNTEGRSLIRFLAGVALAALALPCAAQAYPAKPILMLMPLQAGSAVDVMIRIVAQKMSENMSQQIVIENQPGAAGSIGAERVKRAAARDRSRSCTARAAW